MKYIKGILKCQEPISIFNMKKEDVHRAIRNLAQAENILHNGNNIHSNFGEEFKRARQILEKLLTVKKTIEWDEGK